MPEQDWNGLIMELLPYHRPKWRMLFYSVIIKKKDIFFRALRIITVVSRIFWVLTYTGSDAALGVLSSLFVGNGTLLESTMGQNTAVAGLGDLLQTANTGTETLAFIFAVTFNVP